MYVRIRGKSRLMSTGKVGILPGCSVPALRFSLSLCVPCLYKLQAKLFKCDYRGWHRAGKDTTQELALGRFQLLFSAGRLEEGS